MKLFKSFDLNVTSDYHTYKFASSTGIEVPDGLSPEELEKVKRELWNTVVQDVFNDIAALYHSNPDFQVIWTKRQQAVDQMRILLINTGALQPQ